MNLFRSEEHVRNWPQYNPDSAEGIMPARDWLFVFSTEERKHMLDGNYISRWLPLKSAQQADALRRLGKTGQFWEGPRKS
ncbi:MAG: hypothetical protein HY678_06870 [Chloroflexi bacterium]|nr:hypothetical protein [Chloroflexota bacterium]